MRFLLALPLYLERRSLITMVATLSNIVLTEFELIIIVNGLLMMIIVESMLLTALMIARLVQESVRLLLPSIPVCASFHVTSNAFSLFFDMLWMIQQNLCIRLILCAHWGLFPYSYLVDVIYFDKWLLRWPRFLRGFDVFSRSSHLCPPLALIFNLVILSYCRASIHIL